MVHFLTSTAGIITSVGAACLLLAGLGKWLYGTKKQPGVFRKLGADGRAIRDTLVGRDAIHDSITGEELSPAILGVGARMAHQESETSEIKDAVTSLASSVATLVDLRTEITDLTGRVAHIETAIGMERHLKGLESVQLLRTIESVATGEPPTVGD